MNGIIAICDTCGTVFENRNLIGGKGSITLEFNNSKIGPCPNCGGFGSVPDGLYQYLDDVVSFIKGPEASVSVFKQIEELLSRYKQNPSTKEVVLEKVESISPATAAIFKKAPKQFNYQFWINCLIGILGIAAQFKDDIFKGEDVDIKDKVIEQLLKQNNDLIQDKIYKPYSQPVPKSKPGRNDPCPCGSGKKYKKCHFLIST